MCADAAVVQWGIKSLVKHQLEPRTDSVKHALYKLYDSFVTIMCLVPFK